MSRPQLVIFDLYGTLVQLGGQSHPFRTIMRWARQNGRSPRPEDARTLMTSAGTPTEIFSIMGISPPDHMLSQLEAEVEKELADLRLFEDVLPLLNQLVDWQVPIVVCSNLAQAYGVVVDRLLPRIPLLRCLSYDVGYIKPEREIYQWIVERVAVPPENCLFVGDTRLTDYDGPRCFGFQAKYLNRGVVAPDEEALTELTELLNLWK